MFSSFLSDDAGEPIFLRSQPVLEPHFPAIYGRDTETKTIRTDVVTQTRHILFRKNAHKNQHYNSPLLSFFLNS